MAKQKRDCNVPVLKLSDGTQTFEILFGGPGELIEAKTLPKGLTWSQNSIVVRTTGPYGVQEVEHHPWDAIFCDVLGSRDLHQPGHETAPHRDDECFNGATYIAGLIGMDVDDCQ